MAWQVEFGGKARKQLAEIDAGAARRILDFMRSRVAGSADPRRVGEALKGSRFGDLWRYRVGDYRVIVSIEDHALRVLVIQIGHRREVYR